MCVIIFFSGPHISSKLDFPSYLVTRQHEFKELGGHSQLQLPPLEPSMAGFIRFFPAAADIAFFRPHITETGSLAYLPAIAENVVLYLLVLYALFKLIMRYNDRVLSSSSISFIIFCYCFAITCLLLSGYTVTLTGAIVRYRSFVLPFLITPLAYPLYIRKKLHPTI